MTKHSLFGTAERQSPDEMRRGNAFAQCSMDWWVILCWVLLFGTMGLLVYEAARFGAARALQGVDNATFQEPPPTEEDKG